MIWTLHKEIKQIVEELGIGSDHFRRMDPHREHKILQDVKRHFLTDVDTERWWTCFRYESTSREFKDEQKILPLLCPSEGKKTWMIPCGHENEGVYDTFPETAIQIIERCPVFEYAIVDKKLKWMFVDSRHGHQLHATGQAAVQIMDHFSNVP